MKMEEDTGEILTYIEDRIAEELNKKVKGTNTSKKFEQLFSKANLDKPLILIIDEFDALCEDAISAIVGAFRNIYIARQEQEDKKYVIFGSEDIGAGGVFELSSLITDIV